MSNKRKKNYCRPTISDTCLTKIPLTCTEYDGILPVGSQYEDDECLSGQDIIEDIINILDDHTEQLDMSEFGCCIDYTASDVEKGVVLKDVLSKHENMLCHLLENCCNGESDTTPTSPCQDCDEITENERGLVFNTTGVGNVTLNTAYTNFSPITSYTLNYKTKVKGTYKITVDIDYTGSTASSEQFEVGISLDGQQPTTGAFNQDTAKVANNTKTLHFITDVNKGVNINTFFKKAPSVNVVIEKVKVIIEKVK